MKITAVQMHQVHLIWKDIVHLVEKPVAVYTGHYDVWDLFSQCISGEKVLWVIYTEEPLEYHAIIITRFNHEPLRKTIALDQIGGDKMSEWIELALDTISEFGKDVGCTYMEGYGRDAWEKVGEPLGFKKIYTAFERELT